MTGPSERRLTEPTQPLSQVLTRSDASPATIVRLGSPPAATMVPGHLTSRRHAISNVLWNTRYTALNTYRRRWPWIAAQSSNLQSLVGGVADQAAVAIPGVGRCFNWPVIGPARDSLAPGPYDRWQRFARRSAISCNGCGKGVGVIFLKGAAANGWIDIKFKPGSAMAMEAGVPILPVTIRGAHRVWPPSLRLPRLARWKSSTTRRFKLNNNPVMTFAPVFSEKTNDWHRSFAPHFRKLPNAWLGLCSY